MGNADLNGSGSFHYPSADEYEAALLARIRLLAKDVAKHAKAEKGSEAAVALNDRIERLWSDVERDIAVLRAQERRETKLTARDMLHARLSSFYNVAKANDDAPALLSWETAFKGAILWLARWSGNTPTESGR